MTREERDRFVDAIKTQFNSDHREAGGAAVHGVGLAEVGERRHEIKLHFFLFQYCCNKI